MKSNKKDKRRRKRQRARDRKRGRDGSELAMTVWQGGSNGGLTQPGARVQRRVRLDLESLELAKGHDGFLRGAPEPVIIAGVYVVDGDGARLVARTLWRMERPGGFPCVVKPVDDSIDKRFELTAPAAIVIIALAVEEDGGGDIRALYAALDRVESISVWPRQSDVPAPLGLDELAAQIEGWRDWRSVHAMIDSDHVGDALADDDWIGASALVVPAVARLRSAQRVHFVSDDGLNDWTAELCVRM